METKDQWCKKCDCHFSICECEVVGTNLEQTAREALNKIKAVKSNYELSSISAHPVYYTQFRKDISWSVGLVPELAQGYLDMLALFNNDLDHRLKLKENALNSSHKRIDGLQDEISQLKKDNENLKVKLNTCKNDYWFMSNLLERSKLEGEAVKDCIERMKFRKPLFNVSEVDNV